MSFPEAVLLFRRLQSGRPTGGVCLLGLVFALAWTLQASAADLPLMRQQQGPLELLLTAPVNDGAVEMSLSDSLTLTIGITTPDEVEIKPPAALVTSAAWKTPTASPESGMKQPGWRHTFVIYPMAPGQQVLQIEPFQHRTDHGNWATATWQPIPVKVTTRINDADVKDLRGITDIEKLPPVTSWWDLVPWVLGVIGLAFAVIGIRSWRRRRRSAPILSPGEWARRELDRISALNLPATGEVDRFHTLLSNVMRRYLENRFDLPARRQTTPEFLRAMERSSLLPPDQQDVLRDFLERCDLAKFAGARPAVEECLTTLDTARTFVEKTTHDAGRPPAQVGSEI